MISSVEGSFGVPVLNLVDAGGSARYSVKSQC